MYTKIKLPIRSLFHRLWKMVGFISVYSVFVYGVLYFLDFEAYTLPMTILSILGTAISLLLGFRTNAAYNRWWEARQVWGAIVNDSRTLIRQANGFINPDYQDKKEAILKLSKLQIAWSYALSNGLRKLSTDRELNEYLEEEERNFVLSHNNHHNAILQLLENKIADIYRKGGLHTIQFTSMDHTLKSLCDSMGKCERIKNTAFPVQYGHYIMYSIFIFMLLLPIALVADTGIMVIPISFIVVFFFAMIDAIAKFLQDPFENKKSDTPMTALCTTIEINLLQLAGEDAVPEALKPDKYGVLM